MGRSWKDEIDRLHGYLGSLSFLSSDGAELEVEPAFALWREKTVRLRDRRGTIYLVGNGASASMASHFSADLAKNGHLRTQIFSDLSLITAISNDISYDQVYAEPLSRCAQDGDMLVAISSSGRSPNILNAVDVARRLGVSVVTLTAMDPDNPLRSRGWINAWVPAPDYGHAETSHAAILHRWMDMVEVH